MSSRYDHLNQEELLRLLEARDQRDATRFGLVWESNDIEQDNALNNDFVALDVVPEQCIGSQPWRNLIVEGENFDALRYLRMAFSGQVKCILIDPPYNTGNNDFIYNDRFVAKENSWRHSTWLDFMYRRLTLARDLLSEDGVLFVHIGEEEVYRLGCLLDKVFPGRKVGTFVWRTRSGSNDSKHYFASLDQEYVICYANPEFSFAGSTKSLSDYANPDNDPDGPWVSGDLTKAHGMRERPKAYYPIQNPRSGIWYPCNPERVWAFASESRVEPGQKLRSKPIEQLIRENKILWPEEPHPLSFRTLDELKQSIIEGVAPKNLRLELPDLDFWVGKTIGRNTPRYKKHRSELKRLEKPISTWIVPASTKKEDFDELSAEGNSSLLVTGYTSDGTSLLREMLGNSDFPFPKPLQLIQSLVAQVTDDDDIVLDFFAGSGTTGHAVLAQNAEDDCERRFILVSTTEATADQPDRNVCRDITQKRIGKAINGYSYPTKRGLKEVAGLGGDAAYLRIRRVQAGELLEIAHAEVWTALQLMSLGSVVSFEDAPFLWAGNEDLAICYIPRFRREVVSALRRRIKDSTSVVIYSWQPQTLRQHISEAHVTHLAVSETLTLKFGLNLTLSPV